MNIGGQDITIEHDTPNAVGIVMLFMYSVWPDNIVVWDFSQGADEVFIHQNKAAYLSWEKNGYTEDNSDQMIYLTFEPNQIHCVFKEGQSQTLKIVEGIKQRLNERI